MHGSCGALTVPIVPLSDFLHRPLFRYIRTRTGHSYGLLCHRALLVRILHHRLDLFFPALYVAFYTTLYVTFVSRIFRRFARFTRSLQVFLRVPNLFNGSLGVRVVNTNAIRIIRRLTGIEIVAVFAICVRSWAKVSCSVHEYHRATRQRCVVFGVEYSSAFLLLYKWSTGRLRVP